MKIEMGKKYTSKGKPVRILCTDRNNEYPVIGIYYDNGIILSFDENGKSSILPSYDLQELWEPQEGEWCWFWDDSYENFAHISKYLGMIDDFFKSADGRVWDNCRKFNKYELEDYIKRIME
jgi:hypothetical protein